MPAKQHPQPKRQSRRRLSQDDAGVDAVRARIVAAARHHFLSHGFRGVTMDDLARELGMSKKTFYAHFTSKLALVEAVIRDKADRVEADLGRIAASTSQDFLRTLHDLLACMQGHTGEVQPPFVRDLRREAPALFKIIEERRRKLIQRHFGSLFERGRQLGKVRKDVPADLIVAVLLASTEAIMNPPKMEELSLSPKEGYSAIISIVLEGVLTARRKLS
jgi:AcrR family transcriptional regulator